MAGQDGEAILMIDLPQPMTPPDCDLRGYEYMPLFGTKLFGSMLYTDSTDLEFRVAVKLWWEAWNQCPAGSLPASDKALARFADFGTDLKGWAKVKDMAMRGFTLCSDGRLYHAMLCEAAVKAYDLRIKNDRKREADRKRLQEWRDLQKKRDLESDGNEEGNHPETQTETLDETRFETPDVAGRREGKGSEGSKDSSLRSLSTEPGEFAEFWAAYPRKEGKAKAAKAHKAALRKIKHPEMMAALAKFPWPADRQFAPHAATWLNGERWLDQPELGATPQQSDPKGPSIFDIPGVERYHADGRPIINGDFLDRTTELVLEKALLGRDPTMDDYRMVASWLNAKIDGRDVLAVISRIAHRDNYTTPVSLKFFDRAVREDGRGAAA